MDRKESASNGIGEFAQKYYVSENQEYILALAGDSLRISILVSELSQESDITADNIKKKLGDITKKYTTSQNSDAIAEGLLLIKDQNCFKFHEATFSNIFSIIPPQEDISFKCYGSGKDLATYLIRKLDLCNVSCIMACQRLIAIIDDVAEWIESVGRLSNYGVDLIVITNEGRLWKDTINDSVGIGKINCIHGVEDELNSALLPLKSRLENNTAEKDKTVDTAPPKSNQDRVDTLVSIQTDRDAYPYGSEIIVTVLGLDSVSGEEMVMTVTDVAGDVVHRRTISMSENTDGRHQENIKIRGEGWTQPNSKFRISVKWMDKEASCYVLTDLKTSLELDQEIYSWTDKVYIKAVVPSLISSRNIGEPNSIKSCFVSISTSKGSVEQYRLTEIEAHTGIFTGQVRLTGFPDHSAYNCKALVGGETGGTGPIDGKIGCANEDELHVTLVTAMSAVSNYALIRWNLGEIRWLKNYYSISETATLQVIDRDMNLDPERRDEFLVKVHSDSDPNGIYIKVVETGDATGIFNGDVTFTTDEKSSSPKLRVSKGDTITAEYGDYTLPNPDSANDRMIIFSTCSVGYAPLPALRRVNVRNLRLLDSTKNTITKACVLQDIQIAAELTNLQAIPQKFVYLVQIKNDRGLTIMPPIHSDGLLSPGQTLTPAVSWMPDELGSYTITAFVWESLNNPAALTPQRKLDVVVEDDSPQTLSQKIPVRLGQKPKKPSRYTVYIPLGSSMPGCEKNDECYMPSKLVVGINDTVIWINDDIVVHTVVSGTVDQGVDGNFDSGSFLPGASFVHRFTRKGEYPYFCIVHPWQTGMVVVR